ncbi:MAG: rod shape-determining protein MreD [Patescibacteria group bacterium]|nr:rod shape-determining protein MreD [Patescibacteria group bacterium]
MTKNIFIFIILFYFLILFQTSFLVHFNINGWTPNLILIILILTLFLEKPTNKNAIYVAIICGFFWDIFSETFIGFHILIGLFLVILIKIILKKYIRPIIFSKKNNLWTST